MKNILVIEDEPLIQRTIKVMLEKKGAKVSATSNGKDAIELILNNTYDRIVCDLMLNDITGFDIIEESKRAYSNTEISQKFVIITAYSSEQIIEKAKSYGCPIHPKPLDLNNVINEILCYDGSQLN